MAEWWNPIDWWNGQDESAIGNWLGGIGGDISSGIEGGVIGIFKDLWATWKGFVFIALGAITALFVLVVYFKGETTGLAVSAIQAGVS